MKTMKDKYLNDPQYKKLVDIMVNEIRLCNYTPSEMREAAILASIIYEEHQYKLNPVLINPEIEKALHVLESHMRKVIKGRF